MKTNNYYQILEVPYEFTAFNLLKKYFQKTKIALTSNDTEGFIKLRMGFEVLRHEESLKSYNRIYRKYILNQELNFPKIKEEEMINSIQDKEQLGRQIAEKVIGNNESFSIHLTKYLLMLILFDLLNILSLGASGISFIIIGIFSLVRFHNQINFIGGICLILLGLYFLRKNIKYEILK